jgi:hypothetical protein
MNTKGITPRNEDIPPSIDAQYVPGFVWARQPQLRLTKDFDDHQVWVAVSAESPQTTIATTTAASGVTVTQNQAPTSQFYSGTNYSLNSYPDVVAKVAFDPKLADRTLHVEAFAVGRAFTDRVTIAPTKGTQAATLGLVAGNSTDTQWGGGFGGGAVFSLMPGLLDVQASGMSGNGIGRYGSSQLSDTVTRPDGQLVGIPETMFLAGATLHPIKQLDVYVFGGQEQESNKKYSVGSSLFGIGSGTVASDASCLVEKNGSSCSAATRSINQITAGLWDRFYQGPFGRLQVGLQYSYTQKEAFADSTGLAPKTSENMIFTSFRYYPF